MAVLTALLDHCSCKSFFFTRAVQSDGEWENQVWQMPDGYVVMPLYGHPR